MSILSDFAQDLTCDGVFTAVSYVSTFFPDNSLTEWPLDLNMFYLRCTSQAEMYDWRMLGTCCWRCHVVATPSRCHPLGQLALSSCSAPVNRPPKLSTTKSLPITIPKSCRSADTLGWKSRIRQVNVIFPSRHAPVLQLLALPIAVGAILSQFVRAESRPSHGPMVLPK